MKKLILLSILLIVGCATKQVENRTSTEYTMKMSEDEFKTKNNELEIYEQNKEGIVYKCNLQYYTFMYGKLEAVTPFHGGLDKMQFDITPPSEVTPSDSIETN